jgi:pyridoxamine 5'-phosphate oxidase
MVDDVPVPRIEYLRAPIEGFEVDDVPDAPLGLFRTWLSEAVDFGVPEPNAATLATVNGRGEPSTRLMLVKVVDERGFCFFTNHGSRKGQDLTETGNAALLFPWIGMHRQVAVRGRAERLAREESESYFASRPRAAQVGAWASQQSQPVERAELDARVAALTEHFGDDEPIPMPDNWGGYVLVPEAIEFWVGRFSRLHDRIEYRRRAPGGLDDGAAWTRRRLSP